MANRIFEPKHNMVINIEVTPPNAANYQEILQFIRRCRLRYALTSVQSLLMPYLRQFWDTLHQANGGLQATVNGVTFTFDAAILRNILRLGSEAQENGPVEFPEAMRNGALQRMGYVGDLSTKQIQKGLVFEQWRYLMHVLLITFGAKKGGYDVMNVHLFSGMLSLVYNKPFSFSRYVYQAFQEQLTCLQRLKFMLFPRFTMMIIKHFVHNLDPNVDDVSFVTVLYKKIFTTCQMNARRSDDLRPEETPLFGFLINDQYVAPENDGWLDQVPATGGNVQGVPAVEVGAAVNADVVEPAATIDQPAAVAEGVAPEGGLAEPNPFLQQQILQDVLNQPGANQIVQKPLVQQIPQPIEQVNDDIFQVKNYQGEQEVGIASAVVQDENVDAEAMEVENAGVDAGVNANVDANFGAGIDADIDEGDQGGDINIGDGDSDSKETDSDDNDDGKFPSNTKNASSGKRKLVVESTSSRKQQANKDDSDFDYEVEEVSVSVVTRKRMRTGQSSTPIQQVQEPSGLPEVEPDVIVVSSAPSTATVSVVPPLAGCPGTNKRARSEKAAQVAAEALKEGTFGSQPVHEAMKELIGDHTSITFLMSKMLELLTRVQALEKRNETLDGAIVEYTKRINRQDLLIQRQDDVIRKQNDVINGLLKNPALIPISPLPTTPATSSQQVPPVAPSAPPAEPSCLPQTNSDELPPGQALPIKVLSPQCGTICVQGYNVKQSFAPILEAIFKKHGDIAAECQFKTASVRSSLLEVVCEVVTRIETDDVIEKMEEIECQVSDAEAANINVSWLRAHLEAVHTRKEAMKKSVLLMETKVNTSLVKRAAQMDLRERCEELVDAQERFEKAERCARVLHLVENNLKNAILESKAENALLLKQRVYKAN